MYLYRGSPSRYFFSESPVAECIQPFFRLAPYKQIKASLPAEMVSSFVASPENTLACFLRLELLLSFLRAAPFPTPNNLDVVSQPVIACIKGKK